MPSLGDQDGLKIWCTCIQCQKRGIGLDSGCWVSRTTWYNHRPIRAMPTEGRAHTPTVIRASLIKKPRKLRGQGAAPVAGAGIHPSVWRDVTPPAPGPANPLRPPSEGPLDHYEALGVGAGEDAEPRGADPGVDPDVAVEVVVDPHADVDRDADSDVDPDPDARADPGEDPNADARADPGAEPDGDARAGEGAGNGAQDAGEGAGGTDDAAIHVTLDDMKYALEFIRMLQGATLEGSNLPPETIERMRNPPNEVLKINDPDLLLWIQVFIAVGNASDETYNAVRDAVKTRFPAIKVLSLYKVKKAIKDLSGVVGEVTDMCVKSCIGFTGPFANFARCHKCGEGRYCPIELAAGRKVTRQTFVTMLPGPQIQAIYRSEEGANDLAWFYKTAKGIIIATPRDSPSLAKYFDLVSGQKLLERIADGTIGEHDVILMTSMDGAQLYRNKKSDCWMSLWIIVSISPDKRYKKVYILPGAIIPGPNHPGMIDSFLFPGFYHVSALMREGLTAFNAALQRRILSRLFLALGLSDGPGMAMFNGSVGHHGTLGCRAMCGLLGRHKLGCPHFYPALLKPLGDFPSDHDDVLFASIRAPSVEAYEDNLKLLLSARNETQYKQLRKVTGLCKPTIMSGLSRTLPMPSCFPIDLMHLTCLNLPDLFLSLWRGTIQGSTQSDPKSWDCAILADPDVWQAHGLHVERARHYLPGFFDRPPRNIADKLNSGYKAIEFMTWFYNYVPAMLRSMLPEAYWLQFCKLARGIKILYAEDILPDELIQSKTLLTAAIEEYEVLYYARDPDRLHVVRPAIHLIWHGPDQVVQIGAMVCDTQLPIERLIGDLGSEIKQPSAPYANLSQRAIRRCQVNALKAMLPEIDRTRQAANKVPRGAEVLGDGYMLLCARDRRQRALSAIEQPVFFDYLSIWEPELCTGEARESFSLHVRKWARLRLPNGTVARSAWKECTKPVSKLRLARCIKYTDAQGNMRLGEVRYFCKVGQDRTVAFISVFGARDEALYERSHQTVELLEYFGDEKLAVINVKQIESVVGMIPDVIPVGIDITADYMHLHVGFKYFVVERLGLEVRIFHPDAPGDPEMDVDE